MEQNTKRFTTIVLACFSLLYILPKPAAACCDPPCGPCETCINEVCVDDTDGTDCGDCKECSGGSCVSTCSNTCCNDVCCGSGQNCCGGSCCSNECCNDVCCGSSTDDCCGDECCDPDDCCDGDCCDPDQCCVDGHCSSECWTTDTVLGSTDSCPACSGGSCSGTTEEKQDYDVCASAATGQSGRCECYETEQTVGYTYACKRNWNCSHFLACFGASVGCGVACGIAVCDPVPGDEILCFACLAAVGGGCIPPCSYVEACEKDENNKTPIKADAFSSFGGGSCTG